MTRYSVANNFLTGAWFSYAIVSWRVLYLKIHLQIYTTLWLFNTILWSDWFTIPRKLSLNVFPVQTLFLPYFRPVKVRSNISYFERPISYYANCVLNLNILNGRLESKVPCKSWCKHLSLLKRDMASFLVVPLLRVGSWSEARCPSLLWEWTDQLSMVAAKRIRQLVQLSAVGLLLLTFLIFVQWEDVSSGTRFQRRSFGNDFTKNPLKYFPFVFHL